MNELLQWILGLAAGSGVLVYVARIAIQHVFSRDLERFREDIRREHDVEIERLRSDLARIQYEHEMRFGWLHERRAQVIDELYKKLVRTQHGFETATNMVQVFSMIDTKPSPLVTKLMEDAANGVADLENHYVENKLFLDPDLCSDIDSVLDRLKALPSFFLGHSPRDDRWENPEWRGKAEHSWNAAHQMVTEKVPELMVLVEQRMRDLLGSGGCGPP